MDNLPYFLLLSLWMLTTLRENRWLIAANAIGGVFLYYLQSIWSRSYGWSVTFYRAFLDQSAMAGLPPAEVTISIKDYGTVLITQLISFLKHANYLFLFIPNMTVIISGKKELPESVLITQNWNMDISPLKKS